ncbi:hypothetical protein D1006_27950 [Burkholderia stabilis]|uniref:Lipoprotein n=1 Tax=Burkholderia stabilis TaxID=95485 RepID=A0A4Q2AJG7_9BURK|nr:hypothetical protein D1006_27950 [Burkholderia stabilis]
MRIVALSAATASAVMFVVPAAFAQASAPVVSSVFVHPQYDTGNSAINENFQYIAHPPMRPIAASEPAVVHGTHRGRRGQSGTTGTPSATGSGSNNTAAVPLPTMPADGSSGAPVSQ